MEVVAAFSIVALLASNFLWLKAYERREDTTMVERRELLTRITHPEMVPVTTEPLPPDSELLTADIDDEYGLVGTVEGGENNSDG